MYTLQSRVRYSEVTKDLNMDLYSILNYFQDCSNFQSADLGVGVESYGVRACLAFVSLAGYTNRTAAPFRPDYGRHLALCL